MEALRVALFAPTRERCGIADYSRHLTESLRRLPEIESVQVVSAPEGIVRTSARDLLRHRRADRRLFRSLGRELNAGTIAHLQHQYFFFGGVAPWKNLASDCYGAIRVPLVLTVHEIATPEPNAPPTVQRLLHWANRQNFLHPAIQRWIVHTEPDAQALRQIGVPPERIAVIPVGVPAAAPMPPAEEAKRALGLAGRRVVTLFGFLSSKKGHRVALESVERLPPDTILLFAGDRHPDDATNYVAELKATIAQRHLDNRVQITGYLPEERVPVVMAATDVAIAPFVQSSGSASLAHLFAYGRVVVASDIAPHRPLLAENPDCMALFASENAAALATRIMQALEDDALRTILRQGALDFAARHSYDQMARETAQVYRRALGA